MGAQRRGRAGHVPRGLEVISKVWGMLRTKFVRDAATLQVATGVSQVFQVGTTVALALMLGAEGSVAVLEVHGERLSHILTINVASVRHDAKDGVTSD